jgi:nitrate reductase NapAB chaperone NapD
MPISGLVIRLEPSEQGPSGELLDDLARVRGLSVGPVRGSALAAVLDADDYATHDAALEGVQRLPRVCSVDVVFHDFSDVEGFGSMPRSRREQER